MQATLEEIIQVMQQRKPLQSVLSEEDRIARRSHRRWLSGKYTSYSKNARRKRNEKL